MANNNHDGHRNRMRQKFITNSLSGFEEHEVLEMLLFYSIPRKNTNEIAHELINKFGNIARVLDADIEVLQEVSGVSANSAVLLKMIPQICKLYYNCERSALDFKSLDTIKSFAINQYIGQTNEVLKVIYLDSSCGYISCEDICTMNSAIAVVLNLKKIIERAEKHNSAHVILMHNHPNSNTQPSKDDVNTTVKVEKLLKDIGITLIDHIIVSKNDALSMRSTGYISR